MWFDGIYSDELAPDRYLQCDDCGEVMTVDEVEYLPDDIVYKGGVRRCYCRNCNSYWLNDISRHEYMVKEGIIGEDEE